MPHKRPAIVGHEPLGPLPLIPLFHICDVLVKTFSLLVTNVAQVLREPIEVGMEIMQFYTHAAPQLFEVTQHIVNQFLEVSSFRLPEEVFHNHHERVPRSFLVLAHRAGESRVVDQLVDLGSIEDPRRDLRRAPFREGAIDG